MGEDRPTNEAVPTYAWTITAEPWKVELAKLDPTFRYLDFSMVGRVGPDDCNLTAEQIRSHPQGVPFRVLGPSGEVRTEGVVVGKDTALDECLYDLSRGWPCEIEFFENGDWHRISYPGMGFDDWTPWGL